MTVAALDVTGFTPAALCDQAQPMLMWVKLADCVVDRRYQRSITPAGKRAIQRIADGFSWKKYQPILVASHEGGKFAIVDGQHRAHAALLCGIEAVPAMAVQMTLQEQASGFAVINRDRVKVNGLTIYRAELMAGTGWATRCEALVRAAGCKIATSNPSAAHKKPGEIYGVGLIRRMEAVGEGVAVTAGLAAIRASVQAANVQAYSGPVLAVWLGAIATNQRFMRLPLHEVFDSMDIQDVIDRARHDGRMSGQSARPLAIARVVEALAAWS